MGTIADARNATERLRGVFEAELLEDTYVIDESIDNAIEVKAASFSWDAPPPDTSGKGQEDKKKHSNRKTSESDTNEDPVKEEKVFQLKDATLTIPRGQLVAIVGAVGSGKSSLLQGLIGEMRRTSGSVVFGGSVGYCPQIPWIQVTPSSLSKSIDGVSSVFSDRTLPSGKTSASANLLTRSVTGKLSVNPASFPISPFFQMATSLKSARKESRFLVVKNNALACAV